MRVLLVDDNRLMLEGLQSLMEAHGIEVPGMALDGRDAVAMGARAEAGRHPDGHLHASLRRPDGDSPHQGRDAGGADRHPHNVGRGLRPLRGGQVRGVRLPAQEHQYRRTDRGAGPGATGRTAILPGARSQAPGGVRSPIRAGSATAGRAGAPTPAASPDNTLTPRHLQVLELVSLGLSYKEVGSRLRLSRGR